MISVDKSASVCLVGIGHRKTLRYEDSKKHCAFTLYRIVFFLVDGERTRAARRDQ
jgi:hypothetical protein